MGYLFRNEPENICFKFYFYGFLTMPWIMSKTSILNQINTITNQEDIWIEYVVNCIILVQFSKYGEICTRKVQNIPWNNQMEFSKRKKFYMPWSFKARFTTEKYWSPGNKAKDKCISSKELSLRILKMWIFAHINRDKSSLYNISIFVELKEAVANTVGAPLSSPLISLTISISLPWFLCFCF